MSPFGGFYRGQSVLVTGDTGFKGAWLAYWLSRLGAQVCGLALDPITDPSVFEILDLRGLMDHERVDIRNADSLASFVRKRRPRIVFHLAAQALVRQSYREPLVTLETNVMGTAHLLDAIRGARYSGKDPCAVVVVTSDKCYENHETWWAYREEDRVGGHDPYSASKGAAEIVVSSFRRSFFPVESVATHGVAVATARAGNVIGGGDWSEDRIVADSMRALVAGRPIGVRNPGAIRPWQHVLEPLSGYLALGEALGCRGRENLLLSSEWNFGPGTDSERTVGALADAIVAEWGSGRWEAQEEGGAAHEATYLKLAIDKARHHLGWKPAWDFEEVVRQTVRWYKRSDERRHDKDSMRAFTDDQIGEYCSSARAKGIRWAGAATLESGSMR